MKINGANAHSINFIEQKKLSAFSPQQEKTDRKNNDFVANKIGLTPILELNEFIGVLQVANLFIEKLQDSSDELQKLNEKFLFFKSQKNVLSKKFEEVTTKMLDIIDNTTFQDKGLFYTQHHLAQESLQFNFFTLDTSLIEDFTLEDGKNIDSFKLKLMSLKDEVAQKMTHIEVASFNQLASLEIESFSANIDSRSFSKEFITPNIGLDKIKKSHNLDLLKYKIQFLLS